MDQPILQLLEKIITLYSWSPECVAAIETLAGTDQYCGTTAALEKVLARSIEDRPLEKDDTGLPDDDCYELYTKIVNSGPLFRLLQTVPLLSEASPNVVITFARLADMTPDPETVLRSRDPVFMDFLHTLARSGSISVARTTLDDFTKLVAFDREHPDVRALLEALAETEEWAEQIAQVERKVDESAGAGTSEKPLGPVAQKLYDELTRAEDADDDERTMRALRTDFLKDPRFSTMLREEVLAYAKIRESLPEAEVLFSREIAGATSSVEKYRRVAVEAMDRMDPAEKHAIDTALELRQHAALHFFELRKFAKLDALAYKWPQLAQQLRLDGSGVLKTLETSVIEPDASTAGAGAAWGRYRQDEHLVRFLRLRPLFRDIYKDELTKYFTATQTVTKPAAATVSEADIAPVATAAASFIEAPAYENVLVSIKPAEAGFVSIALTAAGGNLGSVKAPVKSEEVASILASLGEAVQSQLATRGVRALATREMPRADFRQIGTRIFDMFLGSSDLRDPMVRALQADRRLRIVLQVSASELAALPWECLYVPELQVFLGLVQKYSIIRHLPEKATLLPRTLTPPLKILVASASPLDAPPIEASEEIHTLERALAEPREKRQVDIKVLLQAKLSELQQVLRRFRPHLFHFIGHGTYFQETQKGALLFENEDGRTRLLEAEHLRTLLMDSNISLAVLNSCDTGTSAANEVVTGVAGALVNKGIPAAIATMRTIQDQTAVMFTREFYRSFVDGYALEPALIEARKALSVERWDWPAYALFASTLDLHSLKLVPHQRGNESD